jgi:hypothetical protein
VTEAPRSDTRDVPLVRPFQASANINKDTTEQLRSITAQRAISNKAAQLHLAPSSGREASLDVIIQDVEEGTKCGKKKHKQRHQETTTTVDDDGGISKHQA